MGALTMTIPKASGRRIAAAVKKWDREKRRKAKIAIAQTAADVHTYATRTFAGNTEGDALGAHPPTVGTVLKETRSRLGITGPYQGPPFPRPHTRSDNDESERLKQGISVNWESGYTAAITAPAKYAKFVEYGTATSRPHPFMTPAAEAARPRHTERMRKAYR